ncbi:DUF2169 family type VI secretion system accessory protein [Polyangium mundeleinium]|uniref:DUF2169 domain-containing protein n=1 Tax=Polyangium mundeleinium TaxID=2995306 RepID=A0ABT5EII8_9BACT|nr:DUF2169 domain-containing protein [Polyangium mundeleinium]MDC0741631.1 DUF2169 domain-containing protein [Polyangium mundeleinium]
MSFSNATPYVALDVPTTGPDGHALVVAVVKATFDILPGGRIAPSDDPIPLRPNDIPLDAQNPNGSIVLPSDLSIEKHGADVIVTGDAVSKRRAESMDVVVKVKDRTVQLRVHGERRFTQGVAGVVVGPAVPFERMPIVYERAYGGMSEDLTLIEERNPAGVGVAKRKRDLLDRPAPQIEHPLRPHKDAGDKHPPVGLGPIMTHWLPRRTWAGTFDEAWQKTRIPLMPIDFDIRHNNAAHPDLQLDVPLAPGDLLSILGMHEEGVISFEIPAFPVIVRGRFDGGDKVVERPVLDTLVVHPNERRFEVIARKAFRTGRGKRVLRELQVDLST